MTMKTLRSALMGTALAAVVSLAPVALAQRVSTDYDHKADFGQYHTYSFYRVQTSNPLFESRVKDAINYELSQKGWQQVPSGGDVAITAVGDVKDQQEYNTFYSGLGPGFGWGGWGGPFGYGGWGYGGGLGYGGGGGVSTTRGFTVPVGTLIVDLYDTHSHNLVFRGQATDQLHQKHTDKNIAIVNRSVGKIFDHFPPKQK